MKFDEVKLNSGAFSPQRVVNWFRIEEDLPFSGRHKFDLKINVTFKNPGGTVNKPFIVFPTVIIFFFGKSPYR